MAAINKIIFDGNVLIDLTEDTVTTDTLAEGITAHAADGSIIVGTGIVYASLIDSNNESILDNNEQKIIVDNI